MSLSVEENPWEPELKFKVTLLTKMKQYWSKSHQLKNLPQPFRFLSLHSQRKPQHQSSSTAINRRHFNNFRLAWQILNSYMKIVQKKQIMKSYLRKCLTNDSFTTSKSPRYGTSSTQNWGEKSIKNTLYKNVHVSNTVAPLIKQKLKWRRNHFNMKWKWQIDAIRSMNLPSQ